MAVKEILQGKEGINKILEGVNTLAEAVGCTMGYGGRTVLINKGDMFGIIATKDGVSVAREITLLDKFEDMGAQIVYQAAKATGDSAGDGTTTSTVLAQSLVNDGVKLIKANKYNLTEIKNGMNTACEDIIKELEINSREVRKDKRRLKQIATISSNGDESIGELISEAVTSIDSDEVVINTEICSKDHFTKESGFKFESGLYSHHFESKQGTSTLEYTNAKVMVVNGFLADIRDIVEILKKCREENKPLIIFAENVNQNTLTALAKNNLDGAIKVGVIKLPDAGDLRKYSVRDICVATGTKMADKELEVEVADVKYEDLGDISYIKSTMESTSLVFSERRKEDIEKLTQEIKEGFEKAVSDEDLVRTRHLKVRLDRFSEGVVKIHLTASTEIEFKEKFDRVEDSVLAVMSAISEGIIEGGGVGLLKASFNAKSDNRKGSKSFIKGYDLVINSCRAPIDRILYNAGHNKRRIKSIVREVYRNNFTVGYDVKNMKFTNMIDAGIIDPTKVTKNAIKNAVSVSSTLITSNSFMVNYQFSS